MHTRALGTDGLSGLTRGSWEQHVGTALTATQAEQLVHTRGGGWADPSRRPRSSQRAPVCSPRGISLVPDYLGDACRVGALRCRYAALGAALAPAVGRPPAADLSPAWPNCLPCPAQRDPLERAERPLLRLVRQWCGTPWAGGNPSGSGAPEPVFACLGSPVRTAAVGAAAGRELHGLVALCSRAFVFALGEHAQPSPRVDQPLHPTAPGLEALSRAGASRSGVQHMAALIGGREPAPNWISWHSQADAELRGTIIRQVVSGRADQWGGSQLNGAGRRPRRGS